LPGKTGHSFCFPVIPGVPFPEILLAFDKTLEQGGHFFYG
jgi:hypothetical protein